MTPTRSVLAAAALLILSGVGHGLWTGRWQESVALAGAVDRFDRIPLTIGDWQGQPATALDPKILARAGFSGSLARHYVNRRDGSQVSVLLVCGPPGPISLHPPEICMAGAGFEAMAATGKVLARYGSPAQTAEFWAATFRKPGPSGPTHVNVFWSWGATGTWTVPDYPRLAFGAHPVLYKLYVSRQAAQDDEPLESDPCLGFIRGLLPTLETSLFRPVGPPSGNTAPEKVRASRD